MHQITVIGLNLSLAQSRLLFLCEETTKLSSSNPAETRTRKLQFFLNYASQIGASCQIFAQVPNYICGDNALATKLEKQVHVMLTAARSATYKQRKSACPENRSKIGYIARIAEIYIKQLGLFLSFQAD